MPHFKPCCLPPSPPALSLPVRWAHTIRVFTLNSGLFYAAANERTIALMDRITARLAKEKAWDQARALSHSSVLFWGGVESGRGRAASHTGSFLVSSSSDGSANPLERPPPSTHKYTHAQPPQAVFNEEIWFPSHDTYRSSRISVRPGRATAQARKRVRPLPSPLSPSLPPLRSPRSLKTPYTQTTLNSNP